MSVFRSHGRYRYFGHVDAASAHRCFTTDIILFPCQNVKIEISWGLTKKIGTCPIQVNLDHTSNSDQNRTDRKNCIVESYSSS